MSEETAVRRVSATGMLATAVAAQLACGANEMPAREDRPPRPLVREGYARTADGVQLYFRSIGSTGPPIIVVHGGPGFSMQYLVEDLAPLGKRHLLVFYDQRGTGRSTPIADAAALDASRFVDDVETIREQFAAERVTLLGHSWGAGVAALYALRHPEHVNGMLIVAGIPLRKAELDRTLERALARRDELSRRRLRDLAANWRVDPSNPEACRGYYAEWFKPFFGERPIPHGRPGDFCVGPPAAVRNKLTSVDRFTLASLGNWDWRAPLAAVQARTLVVHGDRDVISVESAREWVAALPDARLVLMPGVGHFPYLEAADAFAALVDEFQQGRWPEAAGEPQR